jgi:hypothetical protein
LEKINIQEGTDGVLLEGNLGLFKKIILLEDSLIELQCTNGVLRFDITRFELQKALIEEKKPLTLLKE